MGIFQQAVTAAQALQIQEDGAKASMYIATLIGHYLESKMRINEMLAHPQADGSDRYSIVWSLDEYLLIIDAIRAYVQNDRDALANGELAPMLPFVPPGPTPPPVMGTPQSGG